MCDDRIYVPAVQAKVDSLNREIERLEKRRDQLKRKVNELVAGQSPIKPGDLIEFESGGRTRRGKVISVRATYNGFDYRCHIVTKAGKQIGFANVSSGRCPIKAS